MNQIIKDIAIEKKEWPDDHRDAVELLVTKDHKHRNKVK